MKPVQPLESVLSLGGELGTHPEVGQEFDLMAILAGCRLDSAPAIAARLPSIALTVQPRFFAVRSAMDIGPPGFYISAGCECSTANVAAP